MPEANYQKVNINVDNIRKESQIYQLKPDDKLFEYHKAINEACFSEAMRDPTLLKDKKELQRIARQNINKSGFKYKKGKSRSAMLTSYVSTSGKPKKNVTRDLREKRLEQLREDLKEVDLQLSFSLQQRDKCSNVHNFSKAVEVSQQIDELRKKKRKYQYELDLLHRKEAASKRVKKSISKKKSPTPHTLHQCLGKPVASPPVEIRQSESEFNENEITPDIEVIEDTEANSLRSNEVHIEQDSYRSILTEDSCRSDESLPISCSQPLDQQTYVPEENTNF